MKAPGNSVTLPSKSILLSGLLLCCANAVLLYFAHQAVPDIAHLAAFAIPLLLLSTLLLFLRFEWLFLGIVFLTPLSLSVLSEQYNVGLSLPNEPLIILLMLAILFKTAISGNIDKRVLTHPISIGIYVYLGWLLISASFSTMHTVSFKFLLSRVWFIVAFYFGGIAFFAQKERILKFIWVYALPLCFAVINTLIKHAADGFSREAAFNVMDPFFIDHGIYAATLAFMVPPVLGLVLYGRYFKMSSTSRTWALLLVSILISGIVFSYTRAAWLSLAAAFGFALIFLLRIRFRTLLITGLVLGLAYFQFSEDIMMMLSRNKQASATGFDKQLQSITNISTDYSNLERINRWNSALAMWHDRPLLGFGPGTYIFKYAAYQHSSDLTPISTNFGDGGNAHSEYLNPLAETGWPGLLSVVLLLSLFIITGMKLVYNSRMKHVRYLAWGLVLGLITYYTHGFLNNYSDSDKTLVLIWSFAGMMASLDIFSATGKTTAARPKL